MPREAVAPPTLWVEMDLGDTEVLVNEHPD